MMSTDRRPVVGASSEGTMGLRVDEQESDYRYTSNYVIMDRAGSV